MTEDVLVIVFSEASSVGRSPAVNLPLQNPAPYIQANDNHDATLLIHLLPFLFGKEVVFFPGVLIDTHHILDLPCAHKDGISLGPEVFHDGRHKVPDT